MPRFATARWAVALSCLLPCVVRAQAQWIADRTPVTVIGGIDARPDQYIDRVSGAKRLSDGSIVVANGKPVELRLFDAHGAFIRQVGRLGDGPGEYRGRLDLLAADGDSILIFDQGSHRTMAFGPDGKLLQQWPASDSSPRGEALLFRQSIAVAPLPSALACLNQALARLPAPSKASLRRVVPDDAGGYFVRNDVAAPWVVYNTDGVAIGRVDLPTTFDMYQATRSYVVGKTVSDDGVEQVEVRRLTRPSSPRRGVVSCRELARVAPAAPSSRVDEFKAAIRKAMVGQERAYSNYASYVSTVDSIPGLRSQLPANSTFQVLHATVRGWSGALLDRKSTLACVVGLAGETPTGWPDGLVKCSD